MASLPPINVNVNVENNCSDDEGCCGCFGKKRLDDEESSSDSSTRIEEVHSKSFSEVIVQKPEAIKRQQHYRDLTKYPSGEMTKSKINVRDMQDVFGDELLKAESKDNSKK